MAGGTATGADTARFVDQLKAAHKKRTDELERLVAQLQQDKKRKDREIEALTRENKKLCADFSSLMSKEKLAELIED